MTAKDHLQYGPVDTSPVKSFFVHMLTRDIGLEESILDLLDNCVDGILRSDRTNGGGTPYSGFCAEIDFKGDSFMISDNCGGIPWRLHDYAFKMGRASGRAPDVPGGVGVYGIGMKRAVFKMGQHCLISTQNGRDRYEIEITPKWIGDENEWALPVRAARDERNEDGTTIVVGKLNPDIAKRFSGDAASFKSKLNDMVATHYAFIIDKGFRIRINGDPVKARPTRLVFSKVRSGTKGPRIQPYIFKTKTDGVEVFLAVGFTRPIPSQDEVISEQEEKKYSSLEAGWTVLCNDRAVLYCDRSEMTGWGEADVPRYHTQFIAISGVAEFRSDDASKLPTTTTKRGIDSSSRLYLQVKNRMREGMRIFTDYTNKWKTRADESRRQIEAAGAPLTFEEVKTEAKGLTFRSTKAQVLRGDQYRPKLPLPRPTQSQARRVSFVKDAKDVRAVAEYLFDDPEVDPSRVGEECFDLILKESRK
ncbi:MAG: ATP-binding protein [Terriglobia bacterium]|jgi:hypothetical protein